MSIVITGGGVISPLGIGTEAFREALWSGACGLCPFDGQEGLWGGQVRGFEVHRYLESEKTYLDRASAFALVACSLARREAGFEVERDAGPRAGVVLGTGYGCLETMQVYYERVLERGARFASSLLFSHSYANTPASLAAIEFRLQGYHSTVCSGLNSGAIALGQALDALQDGRAEALFAGGVEALSAPLLRGLSAYLKPPTESLPTLESSAPGIVLGEGAAVFLLETKASVQPQARLTGWGLARSQRLGSGEGLRRAIEAALWEAHRSPEEVDVVLASANGWKATEAEEWAALRAVFPQSVPVTALKSRWGETIGASTSLNLAAALAALAEGRIPATLASRPFPAGIDLVTEIRPAALQVALLTSVDFGGSCGCLVVERAG